MTTEERFLGLIDENRQRIARVCRYYVSMSGIMSADDLFQEIVFNLWKSYPRYVKSPDCQTATWVYRVALNVAISEARKHRKTPKVSIDEKAADFVADDEQPERIELLYSLISQLNREEQALVFLYLEEKSHREMAEIMGISVSNVGTRIQRIKLKLKQLNNE